MRLGSAKKVSVDECLRMTVKDLRESGVLRGDAKEIQLSWSTGPSDDDLATVFDRPGSAHPIAPLQPIHKARHGAHRNPHALRQARDVPGPLEQLLKHHALGHAHRSAADRLSLENAERAGNGDELRGERVHGFLAWIL